jgi:hypothetical protein
MDVDGKMVWVEEDYCSPPLAMERGPFWIDILLKLTLKKFQMNKLVGTRFLAYLRLGNNYSANHYVDLKS